MPKAPPLLPESRLPLIKIGEDGESFRPVFALTQELDQQIIQSLKVHGYVACNNVSLRDGRDSGYCYMKIF